MRHEGQNGRSLAALFAALVLAGCGGGGEEARSGGGPVEVTRSAFGVLGRDETPRADEAPALDPAMQDGSTSETISALLARRSVLAPGPLRQVADAVLAANSRSAEAELRAAALRSEAAQRNWLPRIGPQVSLTSLGAVASSLLLDAVLYDHGGRVAERDYARADVEVAAVRLAQDTNVRVLTALELYLEAEAARGRAAVTEAALVRMRRFDHVMEERMAAGVSDRADRQVVGQKLSRMEAELATDREVAATALAELQAMAAGPVGGLSGLSPVSEPPPGTAPLSVLKAEAEAQRAEAEARVARAGQLPGVGAGADLAGGSGGLTAGGEGFGLGTRARMQAIDAAREAAQGELAEARETAARELGQMTGRLASAERRATEAADLARQAGETWRLQQAQFEAGRKSVTEVIGAFEATVRAEREAVTAAREAQLLRLRLAARAGVLVDGERM
ncbi:TolC family protein [Histidinibacterium aquaticum]|uniref:TolC family protein n=1 Tax=Histidinibacterium aquaticum TaxID=2613962 RepID=A0A5J5GJL4_9RHOB|nr:TolC family protein [Histidinibacterium aquaticum]KAA9007943.1 TolC family protein [Histidinibacterium aquaticum]